jgi:lysophospholipase L1-like esterase
VPRHEAAFYSPYGDNGMITKRKKLLVFGLLTIMVSTVLMACSSDAKSPRLASDAVILAFGDSLTFGTGATLTESYPAILERLVGRRVVNSGVPGEVTGEGLSRLPEVLEKEKPALMILCHGGNDLLRRLDQRQTANNLRAMIRLARERRVTVVMIAVPALGIALSPPLFYRETATEMKIPFDHSYLSQIRSKTAYFFKWRGEMPAIVNAVIGDRTLTHIEYLTPEARPVPMLHKSNVLASAIQCFADAGFETKCCS